MIGSRCGRFEPALKLLKSGRIRLDELISERLPLAEAPRAFARLVKMPSRNTPSIALVMAREFCFSTPRMIMHMCCASMTTPTPWGAIFERLNCRENSWVMRAQGDQLPLEVSAMFHPPHFHTRFEKSPSVDAEPVGSRKILCRGEQADIGEIMPSGLTFLKRTGRVAKTVPSIHPLLHPRVRVKSRIDGMIIVAAIGVGEDLDRLGVDADSPEVDERQVVLLGERLCDAQRARVTLVDQFL
jgi:hypothetical protein